MKQYTPEYIEYVRKYPYEVHENFCNGIENNILFSNKKDAQDYIERGKMKSVRAKFNIIHNELSPEYMPAPSINPILNCNGEPITDVDVITFSR